jgi:YggT family protein
MDIVLGIIDDLLWVLEWIIIIQVALSWLIVFNVLNIHSGGVRNFIVALDRLTAPLYRPIRRMLPDFGGIDFSPLVIIVVIMILRSRVIPGLSERLG